MRTMPVTATADDLRRTADALSDLVRATPLVGSRSAAERAGGEVRLKLESLQRGGAFKVRGAYNRMRRIPESDRPRGVVAFSSGNHAQGVAIAARHLGMPATIVMPPGSSRVKIDAVRGYGAEIVFAEMALRETVSRDLVERTGATLVPPFNDPDVIRGQATVTREILTEWPDVDVVVAPVGGGGLLSGACVACAALRPGTSVVGAEPDGAPKMARSLDAGELVTLAAIATKADGLRPPSAGDLTFGTVRGYGARVALVSDEEIFAAVRFLFERCKLVVEPSGAAALAAVLSGRLPPDARGRRTAVVISGGNVDPATYADILRG